MAGVGRGCERAHRGQSSCISGGRVEAMCCRDSEVGMACRYRRGLISGVVCCKMSGDDDDDGDGDDDDDDDDDDGDDDDDDDDVDDDGFSVFILRSWSQMLICRLLVSFPTDYYAFHSSRSSFVLHLFNMQVDGWFDE